MPNVKHQQSTSLLVVIGHLIAGDDLDGFIGRSALHSEWIDGFDISGGDPDRAEGLLHVLSYLKKNGLKIQLTTTGKNAAVLEQILAQGLGDRVIMEVKGPEALPASAMFKYRTAARRFQVKTEICK